MSELTLQQVSYRYPGGSRYALDGISGTFSAGKLYAVIGPSGSGKSTLLSLMAGLDRPTEGSLQLNGSDYRSLNLDRCRRQEIAMIFQAFQLFPLLTVLENVCFPMEANGVKQKEAKAKAKELLTSVGISEEQYQRYPANLSGGVPLILLLRRGAAAGGHCPRPILRCRDHSGRRAHGQPGHGQRQPGDGDPPAPGSRGRALRDRSHPRHGHRRPGRRGLAYEGRGPGSGGVTGIGAKTPYP